MIHGGLAAGIAACASLMAAAAVARPWGRRARGASRGHHLLRELDGSASVCFDWPERRLPAAEIVRLAAWAGYRCVHSAPISPRVVRWRFEKDDSLPVRAWEEEWLWRAPSS
ncbi:hypothetical protein LZ495_43070 [Yinghuangia sp. KLBMP8922]|uniref:Uncharacterized protein n=1 Tax=Yinghuangia soli TaxID=2908204 RepID=A0AA41U7E4_9ACTN|nr:hypothetical protein [Yinghuangia soli]